jgi:hypothetical protein
MGFKTLSLEIFLTPGRFVRVFQQQKKTEQAHCGSGSTPIETLRLVVVEKRLQGRKVRLATRRAFSCFFEALSDWLERWAFSKESTAQLTSLA